MAQSGSKGTPGIQYGQSDNAMLKQEPQDSKPGQKRRAETLIGVDRKGTQREVGILKPPIVSKPAFGMPLNVDPRMRGDLTEPQQRRGSKTTKESELEPTNLTPDLPHDFRAHSEMYGPSPPRSRYVARMRPEGTTRCWLRLTRKGGNLDSQVCQEDDRAYVLSRNASIAAE
jgi:hypothetical protein